MSRLCVVLNKDERWAEAMPKVQGCQEPRINPCCSCYDRTTLIRIATCGYVLHDPKSSAALIQTMS